MDEMGRRRGWVRARPAPDVATGLRFLARLEGLCMVHWTPVEVGPRGGLRWCRIMVDGVTCEWAFQNLYGEIYDWKWYRHLALQRDGGMCVNPGCGHRATEVDHVVEIQDGGPEFDLSNLRSLCHSCHVTKTNARRRWKSPSLAERILRERTDPHSLDSWVLRQGAPQRAVVDSAPSAPPD